MYQYFTSLVKFIPKHFIFFDTTLKGIIFKISILDSSFLVLQKQKGFFCILCILHFTEFVLIAFYGIWGFQRHKIILSANRENFTSFSNLNHFVSFSYLTALAWTFSTMLNRIGKSKYASLVPDPCFWEKIFQFFTLKYKVSYGLVIHVLYYAHIHSLQI